MMKLPLSKFGSAIAIAFFTFFALGCGGSDDEGGDGDKAGGKKSLADELVGYWAPDPEAMIELAMDKLPEAAKEDADTMAMMKTQMTQLANSMVIHFDGANTTMYGPGAPEKSTYEITSSDEKTNTLIANTINADGEAEEGTAIVNGDNLSLLKDGETLELLRISEAQFKERTTAAEGSGE